MVVLSVAGAMVCLAAVCPQPCTTMAMLTVCTFYYMGLGGSGETSSKEAPCATGPSLSATKGKSKEAKNRLVARGGSNKAVEEELHMLVEAECK